MVSMLGRARVAWRLARDTSQLRGEIASMDFEKLYGHARVGICYFDADLRYV